MSEEKKPRSGVVHDLVVDDLVIDVETIFARIPTMVIKKKDEEEKDNGKIDRE